jgi:hypothetical protein
MAAGARRGQGRGAPARAENPGGAGAGTQAPTQPPQEGSAGAGGEPGRRRRRDSGAKRELISNQRAGTPSYWPGRDRRHPGRLGDGPGDRPDGSVSTSESQMTNDRPSSAGRPVGVTAGIPSSRAENVDPSGLAFFRRPDLRLRANMQVKVGAVPLDGTWFPVAASLAHNSGGTEVGLPPRGQGGRRLSRQRRSFASGRAGRGARHQTAPKVGNGHPARRPFGRGQIPGRGNIGGARRVWSVTDRLSGSLVSAADEPTRLSNFKRCG